MPAPSDARSKMRAYLHESWLLPLSLLLPLEGFGQAPKPCRVFTDTSTVFVGQVGERGRAGEVRLVAEEVFKGTLARQADVSVDGACALQGGVRMVAGERYLVYAQAGADGPADCVRAVPIDAATEDLHFLRNLPAPGSGGSVYGAVWVDRPDANIKMLRGATVTLRGPTGQAVNVVTDDRGAFDAIRLPVGEYRIQTAMPAGYMGAVVETKVVVSDRGCREVNLEAKHASGISGRLLDAAGRGVSGKVKVHVSGDDEPARFITGRALGDGRFDVPMVPPGNYYLFIDLVADGGARTERYYYPGVKAQNEATTIRVLLGEQAHGHDFRVPPELAVRYLEGRVVWPDGTAPAAAHVLLACSEGARPGGLTPEGELPPVRTDAAGRFRLQGFAGRKYRLLARATKATEPGPWHSPGLALTVQDDVADFRLVLSRPGAGEECGRTASRPMKTSGR